MKERVFEPVMVDEKGTIRVFDRVPEFDVRSRKFRAVEDIPKEVPYRSYTWPLKVFLDQQREGACVTFAITHELIAVPKAFKGGSDMFARLLYPVAQQEDEFPGEDYDGTSFLGGYRALHKLKTPSGKLFVPRYEFAFQVYEMIRVVGSKGPVCVGSDWTSDMFNADETGFIHPTGYVAGGHGYCVPGQKINFMKHSVFARYNPGSIHMDKSYFTIHNAWGKDWGQGGRCKISFTDMQYLLSQQGEVVIALERNAA